MVKDEAVEELDSEALMKLTQEAPVVKVTNMLLDEGIRLKASDNIFIIFVGNTGDEFFIIDSGH